MYNIEKYSRLPLPISIETNALTMVRDWFSRSEWTDVAKLCGQKDTKQQKQLQK